MFWILQISQEEEAQRQSQLFTNQAKARRKIRAMARLAERHGMQAHKKELAPEPPTVMVGLAKKSETMAEIVGDVIASTPYIGMIVALPFRIGYGIIKFIRVVMDFNARRELRTFEEGKFKESRELKRSVGIKDPLKRLHRGGFLERIVMLLEEPIVLPWGTKLSPELSFQLRIMFFVLIIVAVVISVAATIVLMQTLGII